MPRTGVTGYHSAERVIANHPTHTILAEARILINRGFQAFVVEIGQRETGHRLRLTRLRGAGRGAEFDPVADWQMEQYCSGAGRCGGYRLGALFFDRGAFERAAQTGITARLVGPDGPVEIHLPAALFAEARSGATWLN